MGQYAPNVLTQADDIRRLTGLIEQLPGNARVAVECRDNKRYQGLVYVRPTMQSFRLRDGTEGLNSLLRLQDADLVTGTDHHIWLDQVLRVERLDSINPRFES